MKQDRMKTTRPPGKDYQWRPVKYDYSWQLTLADSNSTGFVRKIKSPYQ